MGMRLKSQREPSKRCFCVCAGGGRGEHSTSHCRQSIVHVPAWVLVLNSLPVYLSHEHVYTQWETIWIQD